jgi:hypothetical protein
MLSPVAVPPSPMRRPALRSLSSSRRDRRALAAVAVLGLVGVGVTTIPGSGASFSSSSSNPATLAAAADWIAPAVSVADPGSPLRGTVPVSATATDAGSGVASVAIEAAPNAGGDASYVALCAPTASPSSCSWDTTKVADGSYKLRATAKDRDGNAATSAVVSQRVVDNTAPTGTLADPGATLQPGPVALSVTADDATSGVARVVLQRAPSGSSTWTDICTQASAPYSCTWTATAGTYALRAVITDAAGNVTTTPAITRTVKDTTAPTAESVSTTNGGGGAGTIAAGDTIVLRYSEPMLASSILSGLTDQNSATIGVRVTNAGFLGIGGGNEVLSFVASGSGATPRLGTIDLGSSNWLGFAAGTASYTATVTARIVDGATVVTVTLGTRTSGSVPTNTSALRLTWSPSTSATDLAGNATQATDAESASGVAF